MKVFFISLFSIIQLNACSEKTINYSEKFSPDMDFAMNYNFNSPKKEWELPMELDEISGLSYYGKNLLACVNDEEGKIFIYNYKKKKIMKTIVFGNDGDYEGITYQEPNFYILKSNGKLSRYNETTKLTEKIKLPFSSKNNIEGLCFENEHSLLLALKQNAGYYGEKTPFKAIYRYDLINQKTELAYKIPKKKKLGFSGIAKNPKTGKVLIISHRTSEIYQVDQKTKDVDYVWELKRKLFAQPEGICFAPNGKLFISNERSDNESATILEF